MKKFFKSIFKGTSTSDNKQTSEQDNSDKPQSDSNLRELNRQADTLKFDAIRAMKINEFDFAIEALLKSLELRPEFEARYYLAEVYVRAGHADKAHEQMSLLLSEEPEHLPTLLNRAKLLLGMQQADKALVDLEKALGFSSEADDMSVLYYVVAQCHQALDATEEALEAVDKVLAVKGDMHLPAQLLRAELLFDERRFSDLAEDLKKAIESYPDEEQFVIWQGRLYAQSQDWEQALSCFQQVLELNPFSEEAQLGIAKLLIQQGRNEEAESYLRESIEELPSSINLRLLLIDLLKASDRNAEVEALKASLSELDTHTAGADFSQLYAGGLY